MSQRTEDVARAKTAVTAYLISWRHTRAITVRDVQRHVLETTGLDFGPVTIARYIKNNGWIRRGRPGAPVAYDKPETAGAGQ